MFGGSLSIDRLGAAKSLTSMYSFKSASAAPAAPRGAAGDAGDDPSLAPYLSQVETASRVAGGLDFDSGRHRPWSLPRLHAHATLDLSKDRKARRRSRARAAAKRAARDGVAIDGVSGPGRVGLRPAALRDLLGGAPDPDPAADASLDYGALRVAGRRRPPLVDLAASVDAYDPYVACVSAALDKRSQVGEDLRRRLDRPDRTRQHGNSFGSFGSGGRYDAHHERNAIYAYVEAPEPRRSGPTAGRPGWDNSFFTPNVISDEKYRSTISVRPSIVGARVEPNRRENAHAATDSEAVRRSAPLYRLETGSTGTDSWGGGPLRVVAELSPRTGATAKLLREAITAEKRKMQLRADVEDERRIEGLYEAIPKSAGGMLPISRRATERGLFESPRRSPAASPSRRDGETPAAPPRSPKHSPLPAAPEGPANRFPSAA